MAKLYLLLFKITTFIVPSNITGFNYIKFIKRQAVMGINVVFIYLLYGRQNK